MDVDVKTWQRLFPELAIKIEERNCKCGRPWGGWKTFLDQDLAGLKAVACECGRNGITILQPRNAEANKRWMKALAGFMEPKPKKKRKPKPKLRVVQNKKDGQ